MNIVLYSRPQQSHRAEELLYLINALKDSTLSYQINKDFATQITTITGVEFEKNQIYTSYSEINTDSCAMICYGGDGTFLSGVRMLNNLPIPIAGINSGRLGFLANITKNHLHKALEHILKGEFDVAERTLLNVNGDFNHSPSYPYAFNEMTIQRRGPNMISVEVFVNGEMIATYPGDGVLISTPTGSTAYSLSVGGPVVAPDCKCFIISPIAPHNLTMRPVVVPDSSIVTFKVHTRDENVCVSLDNRNYLAPDGAQFKAQKAKKTIFLVHFQNISFYDTLRNKMMWGRDSRDLIK